MTSDSCQHFGINSHFNLYLFINGSTALFWALASFFNFVMFFTQTVGLLGRLISSSQGRYLHTGQHKHRIKAHTDIHASSGIRSHDPSLRASEALDRAATVIGASIFRASLFLPNVGINQADWRASQPRK
jgi:hypothetical protein